MGPDWLSGLSGREVLRRLRRRVRLDAVSESSALLSYYVLFSLFPFLFTLVALLAFFPWAGVEAAQTLDRLSAVMPPPALQLIRGQLDALFESPSPHLLGIGGI